MSLFKMNGLRIYLIVPILSMTLLFGASVSEAQGFDHVHLRKSGQLSFDAVLEQTLRQSPDYLEISARKQEAEAHIAIGTSWIAGRPNVQMDLFEDSFQSNLGQSEFTYGISVPLWRRGEKANMRDLGERYNDQTSAWYDAFVLTTAGKLRMALVDIHDTETLLAIEELATSDAEELLRIVETRFDAGEVAQLEVMQARTLLLNQQRRELQADAARVDAERSYRILTGLSVVPSSPHTEELTTRDEVEADHPQLRLLQSDIYLKEAAINKAESAARGNPTLTLGSRRMKDDNYSPYRNALAVSLSIPFGGKSFIGTASSSARRAKVDAEVKYLTSLRELNTQLHEIEHELFTLRLELPMGLEQAELSRQQWDMARSAFELGESDMSQVVIAMQQAHDSAKAYQTLSLQEQRLITEFNQVIGVLP